MSHDLHLLIVGGETWEAYVEEAGRGSEGRIRGEKHRTGRDNSCKPPRLVIIAV